MSQKLCLCADMPPKKAVKGSREEKSPTPPLPVGLAPPLGFGLGMSLPYRAAGGAAVGHNMPPLSALRPDAPRLGLATKGPRKPQVSDDEVGEETEVLSPSLLIRINTPDHGDEDEVQEEGGEGEEEEESEESDEDEEATEVKKLGDKKLGDKKPGDKKDEDEDGEDEDGEVSVSPFDLAEEMSLSNGFKSVIARNLQQVISVDECAEILSLCSLHFKFLKGEICKCGIRLTKKYQEIGSCAKCWGEKNPVLKPVCSNCDLTILKGKWIETGVCARCLSDIKKRETQEAVVKAKVFAKKKK